MACDWASFHRQYPLVLGPVATEPPFKAGMDVAGIEEVRNIVKSMTLVLAVNLLGLPSAVIPVGIQNGMPQEVQLIGPRFREDLCLDAAEAVEEVLGTVTPIDPRF